MSQLPYIHERLREVQRRQGALEVEQKLIESRLTCARAEGLELLGRLDAYRATAAPASAESGRRPS